MMKLQATLFALAAAALTLAGNPARAQAPVGTAALPATASGVIDRMLRRNPTLGSYASRVHVNLRMLNFPFLAPTLDGTAYYKRPDKNAVVFDRVPSYAKGFEKLFNDVADPSGWKAEWNVSDRGLVRVDGYAQPLVELYMTKKIYSAITSDARAYVDPGNYELLEMVWNYRSGGKIVMRQWYREQAGYSLVSQQHVDISIPHVHAVGDSQYGVYQTNVPVSDAVFKK